MQSCYVSSDGEQFQCNYTGPEVVYSPLTEVALKIKSCRCLWCVCVFCERGQVEVCVCSGFGNLHQARCSWQGRVTDFEGAEGKNKPEP